MKSAIILILFSILSIIDFSFSLFEDQIGKFDWSSKQLGCPDHIYSAQDKSIFVTSKNVLARVNENANIDWRHLYNFTEQTQICLADSHLLIFDGFILRYFQQNTGILLWQKRLTSAHSLKSSMICSQNEFVIVVQNNLFYGKISKNINAIKEKSLKSYIDWFDVSIGRNYFFVAYYSKDNQLMILKIKKEDGSIEERSPSLEHSKSKPQCALQNDFLICISEAKRNIVFTSNLDSNSKFMENDLNVPIDRLEILKTSSVSSKYFLIASTASNLLCQINPSDGKVDILFQIDSNILYDLLIDKSDNRETAVLLVFSRTKMEAKLYNLVTRSLISTISLNNQAKTEAPIKEIRLLSLFRNKYTIISRSADCSINFYEGNFEHDTKAVSKASLLWTRYDGLSLISSVEMVDFPLSYTQAQIETEFSLSDSLFRSFVLRLQSQLEQIRHSFLVFLNSFYESLELIVKGKISISTAFLKLLNIGPTVTKDSDSIIIKRYDTQTVEENIERDFFNTRKIIVATTFTGSIYGINSETGQIIWSMYLGENLSPIIDQLGHPKIPLFLQRGTSFYQLKSQAVVLFGQSGTKNSHLIAFNPVTGEVYDKQVIPGVISRAELLPFHTEEMLFPLLYISNKQLHFYPSLSPDFIPPKPIYLFSIDVKNGRVSGSYLNVQKKELIENWNSVLPGFSPLPSASDENQTERVILLQGKTFSHKVHSQGKVLGDRSVLYKYVNPNLIAIASVNDAKLELHVSLIDGVSGRVVYTSKHERATEPVYLVHCENWISYTYWNERLRRTELTIVELYEGLEQTNPSNFDSFSPLRQPLKVFAQSYIFPQGITAMSVSETDQGLTSRNILVSLPFGSIVELSRRFIDARRPLEMTPELREEMVIPYIPELPLASEDLITYNQTVYVKSIKTVPSGLESTSLVFAYGLDLFYTRVMPSGTFDILKPDFDYVLIGGVMIILTAASVLAKKFWRRNSIKQAWA